MGDVYLLNMSYTGQSATLITHCDFMTGVKVYDGYHGHAAYILYMHDMYMPGCHSIVQEPLFLCVDYMDFGILAATGHRLLVGLNHMAAIVSK
jgi:hypothetical protein